MIDAGTIKKFHANNNNNSSFKFKQEITGVAIAEGTKNVEITMPLKYLINFWRTLEIPLINCEINLILTWPKKCVLSNDIKAITFAIADTNQL